MDKQRLEKHKKHKRELAMLDRQIERLYDSLDKVPVVAGKVTGSGKDFPYIEERITVEMDEPQAVEDIRKRIKEKEDRRRVVLKKMKEVDAFISALPEGIEKRIFELTYQDDLKQREVADTIGYSRGRISQIISEYLKD